MSGKIREPSARGRYDAAVRDALLVLWDASDRSCAKRLKPLLPNLLAALLRHGHLQPDAAVQSKLLTVSPATIDRLLRPVRVVNATVKPIREPTALSRSPFWPAARGRVAPAPGIIEARLIPHREASCKGGGDARPSGPRSLRLTDLYSGWTERSSLTGSSRGELVERLATLIEGLPFRCQALELGSELLFCEGEVARYCADRSIERLGAVRSDSERTPPRGDPVVPGLAGAPTLPQPLTESLTALYSAARLYLNFFSGSCFGSSTPYSRILRSGILSSHDHAQLQGLAERLDPLQLLDEIRALQTQIKKFVSELLVAGTLVHGAARNGSRIANGAGGVATMAYT